MKIAAPIVGATAGPRVHEIDARWLMAYAAALGDTAPEYLDTTRPDGIVAHPLFPVCYEWPLALDLRARTMSETIAARSVHATHDLRLHRRPRSGDRLSTTAAVISAEPRSPGAYIVTRFETVDADGRPVSTTDYGSIYRGVECDRAATTHPHPDPLPPRERESGTLSPPGRGQGEGPPDWSASLRIASNLAHVYTECARIWNPIHTDKAVAKAAGLPAIILHGTATLALAVSEVLRRQPRAAATRVDRIGCRFRGMVSLPSALRLEAWAAPGRVDFRVVAPDGRPAIDDGYLQLAPPS